MAVRVTVGRALVEDAMRVEEAVIGITGNGYPLRSELIVILLAIDIPEPEHDMVSVVGNVLNCCAVRYAILILPEVPASPVLEEFMYFENILF